MINILKNNSGDTIVEVLIAIVILALILSGGYATSNSSLHNIIDAQDREQAIGVAQSQIETLRTEASTYFAPGATEAGYLSGGTTHVFCFGTSASDAGKFYDNSVIHAHCYFGNNYYATIVETGHYTTGNADTYTFLINVTWPAASLNQPYDSMDFYYRVSV